ncbi:TetR/AcrR family transcriptional regulator [Amycolatopsis nigrescens]|uniref:TetR/AcrR family transcriptional regulator n=1 Tax=Amycolatopsis nigrescens TaxID=381445 RepID=UPI00036BE513|nr:TetR/AcrR family transcriptional regulator [Amycolatopsis nigrescens]
MPEPESGLRGRTRQAILDAAASVLSQRPAATLAEIADEAEVGRSTLHRYFAERADLVTALAEDTVARVRLGVEQAALDQGDTVEALYRAVRAYYELGPRLLFLFNEQHQLRDAERFMHEIDEVDRPVRDLIAKGQTDGVFDPEVSVDWLSRVLWAVIYTGWESVRLGELSRHAAPATIIRSLERGLFRQPPR